MIIQHEKAYLGNIWQQNSIKLIWSNVKFFQNIPKHKSQLEKI